VLNLTNSNNCVFTNTSVSSVVLRSSRDPNNPKKSTARNSDGLHKPDSNCVTFPFDDVDDVVFEVLPSPRPKDICSLHTLVTLDSNLECNGRECTVSTVRVVEIVQGKLNLVDCHIMDKLLRLIVPRFSLILQYTQQACFTNIFICPAFNYHFILLA
jgi:hypothetical protein